VIRRAGLTGALRAIEALRPERRTRIVAIDGAGGAGKSTLAEAIAAHRTDVTIVPMDAFAQPDAPGWDHARLARDVLDPLARDEPGAYRRYDWERDALAEWIGVPAGGVVVVEGVTSMHLVLGRYWDLSVWVECAADVRLARGVARDGEGMRSRWVDQWMPDEARYAREHRPRERADLVVDGERPLSGP
jgi:uridine kinase